jgi:uncharacterized metal-binding protein
VLRLRGGGGEEMFFVNLATKEKKSTIKPENLSKCNKVYEILAKTLGVPKESLRLKVEVEKKGAKVMVPVDDKD